MLGIYITWVAGTKDREKKTLIRNRGEGYVIRME